MYFFEILACLKIILKTQFYFEIILKINSKFIHKCSTARKIGRYISVLVLIPKYTEIYRNIPIIAGRYISVLVLIPKYTEIYQNIPIVFFKKIRLHFAVYFGIKSVFFGRRLLPRIVNKRNRYFAVLVRYISVSILLS